MDKKYRVYVVLESVVDLRDGSMHGYWVLTRIKTGDSEISFSEIANKDIRRRAEEMTIRYVAGKVPNKRLFINPPQSIPMNMLPLLSKNFVICLPMDLSLKETAEVLSFVKKSGLKSALNNYKTVGYDLSNIRLGAFDYVFFSDDFYTNASKSDLEKIVASMKLFKTILCFKNIDSQKKLDLALDLGIDLGHGYFFGSEEHVVGIIE